MLHALINKKSTLVFKCEDAERINKKSCKERLSQQNLMQVITDMDFGILKPV